MATGIVPESYFDVSGCHSQHVPGIVRSFRLVDRSTICSVEHLDDQHQLAVPKELAVRLAKNERLLRRSRPSISAPVLRVFFLQGCSCSGAAQSRIHCAAAAMTPSISRTRLGCDT
ncbi:hypothetical protein L1887_49843 [Cichorium endivia]|jgi:hypothetical protein|nr:hypothetical protein L1887_49816 [Cichorium endivia]KAI3486581.1 hypothetical protein L1887_49843 [Cichorium endivia]